MYLVQYNIIVVLLCSEFFNTTFILVSFGRINLGVVV